MGALVPARELNVPETGPLCWITQPSAHAELLIALVRLPAVPVVVSSAVVVYGGNAAGHWPEGPRE